MNDPRFSMLVERCLDRVGSADEMAELQALLREDAEARKLFWEAVEWHALFRQWGEQEWGRQAADAERGGRPMPTAPRPVMRRPQVNADKRKVVRFPFARWVAGIAAAAAVMMLVSKIKSPAPAMTTLPVATVAKVADAVWISEKMESGARLKPGRLKLEKGAVVIAFDRGARVVLEGPVDFEVRDDNSSSLLAGQLRAHVPASAHGFKVETPQFTAVDLGTEFGCNLGVNGPGELHVFTGKVDLHTGDVRSAPVGLTEKQAMRIDHGLATPVTAQPFAFLSENELTRRELLEKGDSLGAWRMAGRQLDENSATLLHLDFENAADAMLPNRAQRAPAGSNASLSGCKPVEGRWPGKKALAFQGAGDRLEFALPGQFESLTLMAWVRVNSLHGWGNPLVSGNGAGAGAGEVQWYFHRDGALRFDVRKSQDANPSENSYHTRPVIGERNFGSWVFVACVLDGANRTVTQYFNGEKLGTKYGFVAVPFQLASAEIGNTRAHPSRNPGDPSSNLDGSIDELAILSTALTQDEIALLYRQGNPKPE